MNYLAVLSLVALLSGLLPAFAAAADEQFSLIKVVLVSRHGVRSPTKSNEALADYSARDWPVWPVAPGELTPHGAQLVAALGHYFRLSYGKQGLFPAAGCPESQAVRVWADVDQRTRVSGDALLGGMFPGCELRADHRRAPESKDQLFHTSICPLDPEIARKAVLEAAGGSLEAVASRYRRPLAELQRILDYKPAHGCATGQSACTLDALPTTLKVNPDSGEVGMAGPLAIASTVSEIFLLETAEGLAQAEVAWGEAAVPSQLSDLLALHNLKFDLLGRPAYIASRRGTLLLDQVMSALNRGTVPGNGAGAEKLVAFVGHDTNIANLAGMLDLKWQIDGQPDNSAPGATLAFELLKAKRSGRHFVRTFLYVQSLEQMRKGSLLDLEHPPLKIALAVPGCDAGGTNLCPVEKFAAIVQRTLDKDCQERAKHADIEAHR
jgi:4-phytase/acid phosphatase